MITISSVPSDLQIHTKAPNRDERTWADPKVFREVDIIAKEPVRLMIRGDTRRDLGTGHLAAIQVIMHASRPAESGGGGGSFDLVQGGRRVLRVGLGDGCKAGIRLHTQSVPDKAIQR